VIKNPDTYIKNMLRDYRRNAEKSGKVFVLSVDEFKVLIFQACHYCDSPPSLRPTGAIPVNGIDRVDSSIGYVLSNCVPCCTTCNKMKSSLSLQDFKNAIRKIYEKGV